MPANPTTTAANSPDRAAPAVRHLEFLSRRIRDLTGAESPALLTDPQIARRQAEIGRTCEQILVERDQLVAAGLDLERGPPPESLQFLIDIQHLLCDLLDEHCRLIVSVRQLTHDWIQLAGRLLDQVPLHYSDVSPLGEQVGALARQLQPTDLSEDWSAILSTARRTLWETSLPRNLPGRSLVVDILCEALCGACHAAIIARSASRPRAMDAVNAMLLRDVGWLSLLHHRESSRARGNARLAWLYRQHSAVGSALLGAVKRTPREVERLIGGHHERCDGRGMRRRPAAMQSGPTQLAAVLTRLTELARDPTESAEALVAVLREEAEAGRWSAEAVEVVRASGIVLSPAVGDALPAPVDAGGRARELHGPQPALQGTHDASRRGGSGPLPQLTTGGSRLTTPKLAASATFQSTLDLKSARGS